MPADEGHGPQFFFGQDAELKRKRGEDDGRIHVGRVVGGVYGDSVFAKILGPVDGEAGAGDFHATASPDPGDPVLEAPTLIPKGNERARCCRRLPCSRRRPGLEECWCASGRNGAADRGDGDGSRKLAYAFHSLTGA